MAWAIPPGGSIIPASKADRYLMSDGALYSAYDLCCDARNVHHLASKTMSHRLCAGERDLSVIFQRRTTRPKRTVAPGERAYDWGRT